MHGGWNLIDAILNKAVIVCLCLQCSLWLSACCLCGRICLPSAGASVAGAAAPSSTAGAAASVKMPLGKPISD